MANGCGNDACCGPVMEPVVVGVPAAAVARHYRVQGLDCAEEIGALRRAFSGVVPSEDLGFDVLKGRMSVPAHVPVERVVSVVAGTGMRAEPWRDDAPPTSSITTRDVLVGGSAAATAIGFVVHGLLGGWPAAIGADHEAAVPIAAVAAYVVAIGAGLWIVAPKAWFAARSLRPDMNLLMTLAVVGAAAIGEWLEAATVSWLFALSLALEAWSVGRARRAISALLALAPDKIRWIADDGTEHEVDPATVPVGAAFRVRPGERIGLDGRIERGLTEVDQAPITGESTLVAKEPGDEVFAGTINGSGVLEVRSTRQAGDTTLARIIRQVGDAQAGRSASERWVERFARIYTPAVLAAALAVAVLGPLFGGEPSVWVYRALVLLVLGCPCALVIATPVAIVTSVAAAARRGVLLKSGRIAEVPARIRAIALDKTGTLTEGRARVVDARAVGGASVSEVLRRAAALEAHASHPIARAIVAAAAERGLVAPPAVDVVAKHGRGVVGVLDGVPSWIGSRRMVVELGFEVPDVAEHPPGSTPVFVGDADGVIGHVAIADGVRPDAAAAIRALRAAGNGRIVMLTGDDAAAAQAIAAQVGIDEVRAGLLPEDKVRAIVELEASAGPTAMVGDGVNDAPALARATLGVAMGAAGTDAAIETADVALMGDDLARLAWAIEHARATVSVIRVNTALALGIKAVFAVLTFAGWASLWAAIAADMGASLLVVALALRLLRR